MRCVGYRVKRCAHAIGGYSGVGLELLAHDWVAIGHVIEPKLTGAALVLGCAFPMTLHLRLFACCLLLGLACVLEAQTDADLKRGRTQYLKWCANCHGEQHEGGLGRSLKTDPFKQVGTSISFLEYVKKGNTKVGMPSFGGALSDKQIGSVEQYIIAVRKEAAAGAGDGARSEAGASSRAPTGDTHAFEVEDFFELEGTPWAIRFFADGSGGFVTRREGTLHRFNQEGELFEICGTPEVQVGGQGGLMEVALHPDYADNGWVYLAYSHKLADAKRAMTRIVRGRVQSDRWLREELIYEAPEETYVGSKNHWGVRIVFQDGYLFFPIGDRGKMQDAQDLTKPNGKIHRIYDDGRVPADNPFVKEPDALPSIWAYGVRNPQGLDLHPSTGALWEAEHGPKGGDEINLIEPGKNYGWPEITYGINYNGKPITDRTEAPGMEQPKHYWVPSIAVCGIDFYEGTVFPNWNANLFAGGLAAQELHRLIIQDGEVVDSEIVLKGEGRIRDVETGPDGYLYLVLNSPDKVVRLVPGD